MILLSGSIRNRASELQGMLSYSKTIFIPMINPTLPEKSSTLLKNKSSKQKILTPRR